MVHVRSQSLRQPGPLQDSQRTGRVDSLCGLFAHLTLHGSILGLDNNLGYLSGAPLESWTGCDVLAPWNPLQPWVLTDLHPKSLHTHLGPGPTRRFKLSVSESC